MNKQTIALALAIVFTASIGLAATDYNLLTGERIVTINHWDEDNEFCETCVLDDDPSDCAPNNPGDPCTCNGNTLDARQLTGDPDSEESCEILHRR